MRKLKVLSLLVVIFAFFVSCTQNKEGYLERFDKFVQKVQGKKNISDSEQYKLSEKFYKLSVLDYDKFEDELTADEKQKIIILKANYYKTIAVFE